MLEKRRSTRYQPTDEIFARIKSSIPVRIVDVSRHGMRVESTSALPPAGECDLWIPGDDGDVRVKIRVQRCRARFMQRDDGYRGLTYQAGLEFIEMDEKARFALVTIVQRLEDEFGESQEISGEVEEGAAAESEDQPGIDLQNVS
jgi:hypothetical protein